MQQEVTTQQRQIKFRAYHKKDNDWLRGHNNELLVFGPVNTMANAMNPNDLVIQQYIGVADKNGKELFEGDLVKYSWEAYEHDVQSSIGHIYFEDGIFLFGKSDGFATNDSNFLKDSIEWIGMSVLLT